MQIDTIFFWSRLGNTNNSILKLLLTSVQLSFWSEMYYKSQKQERVVLLL